MITQPATLDITVPGTAINQVLAYWSGGTTEAPYLGDDTIIIDGTEITGELIGGPTFFYGSYQFTAYRADITLEGLVSLGANSLTVEGMNYIFTGSDENNGVGIVVIYDDGTSANIEVRDGLDLAFFDFPGDRQVTVPQTFSFPAPGVDTTADLVIMSGSVGENRPNEVKVTINGSVQSFLNELGSTDGPLWDSIMLTVDIPAAATELTLEVISTPGSDPLGASLSWVASALAVPPPPELASIGDRVWHDVNRNGVQDGGEAGVEGVAVHLEDCSGNVLASTTTGPNGYYMFVDLPSGDYNVRFELPTGYVFTGQDQAADDVDSDADPTTGVAACTFLDPGEEDTTWDAGIYVPEEGCTHTIGYWRNHTGLGNGNQDDVVTAMLPVWLGDPAGTKSLQVTTAQIAYDVLERKTYGHSSNGITKLYAQLLGTKLSIIDGASDAAVANAITEADAFLADHDWNDWSSLSREDKDMVLAWKDMFDNYNNGLIGPGHCDDVEAARYIGITDRY